MAHDILERIAKADLCTGCGLCAAIAGDPRVTMQMSESGYLRPSVVGELTASEDAAIRATCPGLGVTQVAEQGVSVDPRWGPIRYLGSGYATDADWRHHASSGGALSAVLRHLMETGQIDGVIQVAGDSTRPIDNVTVINRASEGILAAAGSRYAPSAPLAGLHEVLRQQARFAFVGKPCDVAALRAYAEIRPEIDERIPYKLSFFCAGIPSRHGTERILEKLGVSEDRLRAFKFRGDGWPGFATATTVEGETSRMSYHDSWGGILSNHLQPRCKICADGVGSLADIVCADAWHCDEDGYPLFDEEHGRSAIVARTETGQAILSAAIDAGYLETEPLDPETLVAMQPFQSRRKGLSLMRMLALRLFGRRVPRYRNLNLVWVARRLSFVEAGRNFAGTVRRILRGAM